MTEFRLTQISDTHLARRHQKLTDNFHRLSEHIDAKRPDLVVNSGDLAFDAPTNGDDLEFAKTEIWVRRNSVMQYSLLADHTFCRCRNGDEFSASPMHSRHYPRRRMIQYSSE